MNGSNHKIPVQVGDAPRGRAAPLGEPEKVSPSTGVWVRSWGTSRSWPRGQEEGRSTPPPFLASSCGRRQTDGRGPGAGAPSLAQGRGLHPGPGGACQCVAQERHPWVGTASSYQAHFDSLRGHRGAAFCCFLTRYCLCLKAKISDYSVTRSCEREMPGA